MEEFNEALNPRKTYRLMLPVGWIIISNAESEGPHWIKCVKDKEKCWVRYSDISCIVEVDYRTGK